jgi:DNA polymerase-3 subunit alpha
MARGMRRVPTYYSDLIEIIGQNPGHVIGSTACLGGMLPTQLMKYKETQSEELYVQIQNWCIKMDHLFGHGNFYLELQPSASKEQTYVNRQLITIANNLNIDYIITTDSHYLNKEKAAIHAAFLNAQDGDREVSSFYATTYLMDTEELESYMDLTEEEFERAYNSILKIKNSCEDFSVKKPLKIPELTWKEPVLYPYNKCKEYIKKIPYLKTFMESDYRGDKVLAGVILERLVNDITLQTEATYREINQNLEATWISSEVNKTHWSAYYLNLQGIIDTCWEAGSLVGPGRGSGVGFILLYILGITQINPLRETTKVFSW